MYFPLSYFNSNPSSLTLTNSHFEIVSNVRVAQAMQVNVYKVATKTALFIHEKIITEEVNDLILFFPSFLSK